jgi:23S rRNA-/tRNA-specific pseudouridylate synthase
MATLLLLLPHTGRTHQLRIHTSDMGHPILGDTTYGKRYRSTYKAMRVLLHAEALAFTHPRTLATLECLAPLPADFKQCMEALF